MVDYSGRKGVAVEVGHTIGADYHGAVLLVESVDELLNGVLVEVGIVGIELDGELTAFGVMERYVPVSADGVPSLVLSNIDEFVVVQEALDDVHRTIFGVVVHNDDVVFVFGVHFLAECALDGVTNSADAVLAGDNDGSLIFKTCGRHVHVFELGGKIAVDVFEVLCNSLLHFDLYGAVLRVNVVEEFLS